MTDKPAYKDTSLSFEERVDDLVSRMTLEEKISQMVFDAVAIERLDVPQHNWWNECLHGVARAGIATVFPQGIGMGATWNPQLVNKVADAISDEARAKHHAAARNGLREIYFGLSFWTPNVNIFRDPRWGRGQETYGEDPYLMARTGVAFVKGLQGDDSKYLKVIATPKHYAVHSGPEKERHEFDAKASLRDMRETYLPAFEATVREAGAYSVMGAYNRTNGEPCCASPTLLQEILREEWGFDGYVVSDCGAIGDIYLHHKVVKTAAEAAALAVNNGCDLNCGATYPALVDAVAQGLISEETIDQAVKRLFMARFRLGMFDPPEEVAYSQIPITINASEEHHQLALQLARESMVLLKNDGILPLSKDVGTVAVIGPNANDPLVLRANYYGTPPKAVTPLEGIRAILPPEIGVLYDPGRLLYHEELEKHPESEEWGQHPWMLSPVEVARSADVVIFVGGISQLLEGEEGQMEGLTGGQTSRGDRATLGLPRIQENLLKAIHATGTPVVLVLLNGSPVSVPWAQENVSAILEAWYPGQAGGTAIAEVLFGDYNPAGRLPLTIYKSVADLPDFRDYDMQGRTYRYFEGEPLYAFGYGLSYAEFVYSNLVVERTEIKADDTVSVSVAVKNVSDVAGDEVVQLYVKDVEASVPVPLHHLEGFTRLHLEPGQSEIVCFELTPRQFSIVDDNGKYVVESGEFLVAVGGRQPRHAEYPGGSEDILVGKFTVVD
ncbi:MAG: glycoside hydrolase family 3 C-terminal domain-containing protein [Anaerolineales bacterium]|nr:glycoside hydrolase family 3 C-terminal domain-containing protein [Anaerolineales bacterium]